MVTYGIYNKLGLFHCRTVEISLQYEDILARVNTINNWAEVNNMVHAVPSTKHRMMFKLKYAVKHYYYFSKQ